MARNEYEYHHRRWSDDFETYPRVKEYSRIKFKRDTADIIEELIPAVISDRYGPYVYENFWATPSDEFLREIGNID